MNDFLLFAALVLVFGCTASSQNGSNPQGIQGTVVWVSGNFMPVTTEEGQKVPDKGTTKPIVREIHIYEATPVDQATGNAPFFDKINTKLVTVVQSNADGEFFVALPAGTYSLFVEEDQGLFANRFSSQYIQPVEVEEGKVSTVDLQVDYEAAY